MRRLTRWLVRFALLVLLLVGGFALYHVVDRHLIHRAGEERLTAALAELDRTDPGWRLDDLLAAREARFPPPDRNPMRLVQQIEFLPAFMTWPPDGDWRPADPNRRPLDRHAHALVCLRDECRPSTDRLQPLKGMGPGGYPLAVPADVFGLNTNLTWKARSAAALLETDAAAAALAGDPDRAVSSCHACLAAGRGIGDEPILLSCLMRTAIDILSARAVERTLGLCEPRAGLAELQAALLAEADAPLLADGFRGERAMLDRLFLNLADGTLKEAAVGYDKPFLDDPEAAFQAWKYRAWRADDRAEMLQTMTAYLAAARRPPHERLDAFDAAISTPRDPDPQRHLITNLFVPAVKKVVAADLRAKAVLRAAAVGIACERFRLRTGRWPTGWIDLRDFLPAPPLDPFTGQPLKRLRRPDGLTIYAVGEDGTDDGGKTLTPGGTSGTDLGVRLFDVTHRSADPLPEPPDDDPEDRP